MRSGDFSQSESARLGVAGILDRERAGLLVASRLWATGRSVDEARVKEARDALLLGNHVRYLASVPSYARLAAEMGLTKVNDVGTIIEELLVGVTLFKSYDDSLLERGDFWGLTAWVEEVSTLTPKPCLHGVGSVSEWCAAMEQAGIVVTVSSGTSGRSSFIPRDAPTLAALKNNGRCYSNLAWGGYADGMPDFDALLVTASARQRNGLNAVAAGLAEMAGRSLNLSITEGGQQVPETLTSAIELIEFARREHHRLLVFGAPSALTELCARALKAGRSIRLPDDAMVVTGGGWKSSSAEIDRGHFSRLLFDAMGITAAQTLDVYGLSECNAYMLRCAHGRYHVPPVLEAAIVDESLHALSGPDRTGLIALLDPFAFSYPGFLLTGDWGRLVTWACDCGLEGPGFVGEIVRAHGAEAKGCAGVPSGVVM
jgi:hypothetical protein